MSLRGNITNISRASLHDGTGVRTVVYFKGCGLRCAWCHNPETLSAHPDVLYAPVKCIHCGKCLDLCPEHHVIRGGNMVFLRQGCSSCGKCAEVCPSGALSRSSKEMSVSELMAEIRKDLPYYRATSGGVTLSGGECLLWADLCAELLSACKNENIGTCIETALFVPWGNIEKVLPYCDAFFADLKLPSSEKHKHYTGQDNTLILENLSRLVSAAPQRVTVRIPLIPEVNDSLEDAEAFAKILSPLANMLSGIELLRYNNLAESKYTQLSKAYTDFGAPQTDEKLISLCSALESALSNSTRVFAVL